jgi:hypothetical protein
MAIPLFGKESEGRAMVHEKRIKNEENAVLLQYRAREQAAVSSVGRLLTRAVLYRCPKEWRPLDNLAPML